MEPLDCMITGIEGYPGYLVCSGGTVISKKGQPLKPSIDKGGYETVGLYFNGKASTKKVHRLVAEAFLPNTNNLPTVNHRDGNKTNNDLSNIEWATYSYNNKHAFMLGLNKPVNEMPVESYDRDTGKRIGSYKSMREASRRTNTPFANVHMACNGKRKIAGGMKWRFRLISNSEDENE